LGGLSFIVGTLPLFYISFVALYWMCCRRKFGHRMLEKIHGWIRGNTGHIIAASSQENLPDRLINPTEYEEDLTDLVPVQFNDEAKLSDYSTEDN